jgi:RNA ligase
MYKKAYIPTFEEATAICERYGDLVFYNTTTYVDGFRVVSFNYRLATYDDFVEADAFELRGLTYVFDHTDALHKRYLLFRKFFNLNQVAETMLHNIKHVPIRAVHDKVDGSVVSFIRLPNNRVIARTKMGFNNQQTEDAQAIYDRTPVLQRFVEHCLDNDLVPIFEYVSPFNRVVLKYDESRLILLRIRDNSSGDYLDTHALGSIAEGVDVAADLTGEYTDWNTLLEHLPGWVEREGVVVHLDNGQLVKLKTEWYTDRHSLFTETRRFNRYIALALDEKLDDMFSVLGENDTEVRSVLESVEQQVRKYLSEKHAEVTAMVEMYRHAYNSNRKAFAIDMHRTPLFGIAIRCIEHEDALAAIRADSALQEEVEQIIRDRSSGLAVTKYSRESVTLANRISMNADLLTMLKNHLRTGTHHLSDAKHFMETGELR